MRAIISNEAISAVASTILYSSSSPSLFKPRQNRSKGRLGGPAHRPNDLVTSVGV